VNPRRITPLDVQCPSCGAAQGERCRSLPRAGIQAAPVSSPHQPRRTGAKRLDDQLHPEHVAGQLRLWGKR
jgi:hypothetical protein